MRRGAAAGAPGRDSSMPLTTSIRIGRVAGVELGLNWSWLIAAGLIVWVLAAGVFPEGNPGLSDGTYVVMAVAAAVAFFACLLAHELGHAVAARHEGVEIDGITLWVFGGVARFKAMFPSAGAEFRIAVAGPLVSLLLGVILLGFVLLVPLPAAVDGAVHWLGYINLVLLGFNLLPALPLDGGRVLRAALWARKGDFAAATRAAAGLGRGFGQVLIAFGVLTAILGGAIGGIWLAFIGWFLLMAAESEAAAAAARSVLSGVRVEEVMVRDPVSVAPAQPLDRFMDEVFLHYRHVAYPVAENGTAVGIVSFRDVAASDRSRWSERTVADAMVPVERALVVDPDAELSEVLPQLSQTEPRRALVCRGGRLAGLLSVTDATRALEGLAAVRSEPPAPQQRPAAR
jgi:Zn-dependent protease/predicted transcriptional regulator